MSYPNSPFDPEIEVWGWPWHGLVWSYYPSTNGVLTLPSGATIACRYPHYNETHLWDIGRPPANIETENPDEIWLNKAIVRRVTTDENVGMCAWYGGVRSSGYPIYVPGAGVSIRACTLTFNDFTRNITAIASFTGKADISRVFTLADCGVDGADNIGSMAIRQIAESPDGRRSVYLLIPYSTGFGSSQIELFGRSLIELTYHVNSSNFDISISVVKSYSSRVGIHTNSVTNYDEWAAMRRVVWYVDQAGVPSVEGQLSEGPPDNSGNWKSTPSWPVGSQTLSTRHEMPCWAWYNGGALEVLSFVHERTFQGSYSGTYDSRSASETDITTVTVSVGGRSSSVSLRTEMSAAGDRNTTTSTSRFYADEVELYQVVSNQNGVISGIDTYGPPETLSDPGASGMVNYLLQLSNNMIAAMLPRVAFAQGSTAYETWVASALVPGGVDAGRHVLPRTATADERDCWLRGSYNPITGQAIRHLTDRYCSWV